MTNSAGLLFQYLSLSSTYIVAWHRDWVYFQSYFELSFSSKYKVTNSQWSGNLRDDHSATLVILLWCNCQCISCHLSLHHARGPCRPINLINLWTASCIASIGRNVEIRARLISRWMIVQCSQGHVWLVARTASRTRRRTENSWTYLSHPPNTSFLSPNHPFYFFA